MGQFHGLPEQHAALVVETADGVDERAAELQQTPAVPRGVACGLGLRPGPPEAVDAGIDGTGFERGAARGQQAVRDRSGRDAGWRGRDARPRRTAQCRGRLEAEIAHEQSFDLGDVTQCGAGARVGPGAVADAGARSGRRAALTGAAAQALA